MKAYKLELAAFCGFFLILIFALSGCETRSSETGNSNPVLTQEIDEAENELIALRNADFDYIYSFRRKDGKPMDADDKRFVKDNSHFATNRFTLTSDEKVIFAGSNYKFDDAGLDNLKERFAFEDFSKPEEVFKKKRLEREATKDKDGNANKSALEKQ